MNVAIYMKGDGQGRDSKAATRQGMDTFLAEIKEACRNRRWRWKSALPSRKNLEEVSKERIFESGNPGNPKRKIP